MGVRKIHAFLRPWFLVIYDGFRPAEQNVETNSTINDAEKLANLDSGENVQLDETNSDRSRVKIHCVSDKEVGGSKKF